MRYLFFRYSSIFWGLYIGVALSPAWGEENNMPAAELIEVNSASTLPQNLHEALKNYESADSFSKQQEHAENIQDLLRKAFLSPSSKNPDSLSHAQINYILNQYGTGQEHLETYEDNLEKQRNQSQLRKETNYNPPPKKSRSEIEKEISEKKQKMVEDFHESLEGFRNSPTEAGQLKHIKKIEDLYKSATHLAPGNNNYLSPETVANILSQHPEAVADLKKIGVFNSALKPSLAKKEYSPHPASSLLSKLQQNNHFTNNQASERQVPLIPHSSVQHFRSALSSHLHNYRK